MSATDYFRTRLWLWASVTSALIVAVGYAPIVHEGGESFSYWGCWGIVLRGGTFVGTPADTGLILIRFGGMWGLLLIAAGWVIHRALLAALPGTRSARPPRRPSVGAAVVVVAALLAPLAACGLARLRTPPLPKAGLEYPGGVSFVHGQVVYWSAPDVLNPGPCPLTVHVRGADLDGATLASPDRLRGLGWEVSVVHRTGDGQVYSEAARTPGRAVECTYIRGRLAMVRVGMHTVPAAGDPPPESVAVSLGGGRVALPSSKEAIVAAVGFPIAER